MLSGPNSDIDSQELQRARIPEQEEDRKDLVEDPDLAPETSLHIPGEERNDDQRAGSQEQWSLAEAPQDEDPGLESLAAHAHESLAGYKAPRANLIVDEIVRSPSGKPDYRRASRAAKEMLGLE